MRVIVVVCLALFFGFNLNAQNSNIEARDTILTFDPVTGKEEMKVVVFNREIKEKKQHPKPEKLSVTPEEGNFAVRDTVIAYDPVTLKEEIRVVERWYKSKEDYEKEQKVMQEWIEKQSKQKN